MASFRLPPKLKRIGSLHSEDNEQDCQKRTMLIAVRRRVGAVGMLLQPFSIKDRDEAPLMANETAAFELLERDCHTGSRRPEHGGKELMGKGNFVAVHTISRHEQPARQTLLDLAAPVRQGGLGGLDHEGMCIAQQRLVQGNALADGLAQSASRQALALPRDLHVGLVRSSVVVAHHHRQAGHSLAPNDADFDRSLACTVGDNGCHAALDEVDILDTLFASLQRLADRKVGGFQVRFEQAEVGRRQPRQQAVR